MNSSEQPQGPNKKKGAVGINLPPRPASAPLEQPSVNVETLETGRVFDYTAMDAKGKEIKEKIQASNQNEAIKRLREMGYFPTQVKELGDKKRWKEEMRKRNKEEAIVELKSIIANAEKIIREKEEKEKAILKRLVEIRGKITESKPNISELDAKIAALISELKETKKLNWWKRFWKGVDLEHEIHKLENKKKGF